MRLTSKFLFISLYVLYLSTHAFAQKNTAKDSTKVRTPVSLSTLGLGADLYQPILSLFTNNYRAFEVNSFLSWENKYFFTADLGASQRTRIGSLEPMTYQQNGQYVRLGFEKNMLHKAGIKDALNVCGALAASNGSHRLQTTYQDIVWLDQIYDSGWQKYSMIWLEGALALRVRIKGRLMLNYRFSYKHRLYKSHDIVYPNDVSGFGLHNKNGRFNFQYGFNLTIGQ